MFRSVMTQISPIMPDLSSFMGNRRSRSVMPKIASKLRSVMVEFPPVVTNVTAPVVISVVGKSRLAYQQTRNDTNPQHG